MYSLLSLPEKEDPFVQLKPTVELLGKTVAEVQKPIDFIAGKYDSLLTSVTTS